MDHQKFEENRQRLMAQLNQRRRDNAIKRKVDHNRTKAAPAPAPASVPRAPRKSVVCFGTKGLFINSLMTILQTTSTVFHFDQSEKAAEFIADNEIDLVIMDMDLPTDWRTSTDVFTSVMMLRAQTRFLLCSGDTDSVPVQTLCAQGARIIRKPVSAEEIKSFILV